MGQQQTTVEHQKAFVHVKEDNQRYGIVLQPSAKALFPFHPNCFEHLKLPARANRPIYYLISFILVFANKTM
jgi:hypothetical protein